jgi:signal transduction histidine kinase/ligand-binding sensor domain-containing protein
MAGHRRFSQRSFGWLLIPLVSLLIHAPGFALDPLKPLATQIHRSWRSEDGLPQDSATALLESRDGFLWIGTRAGLVRFDGATFETFSRLNVPGFNHNEIQCLAETADGSLWIGTSESGLYRFQRGVLQSLGPDEGLPERPIRRLHCDRKGTLWAAPVEGPLYRLEGSRFQAISSDSSQLRIGALAESPEGTLWVGTTGGGLWRVRQDRLVLAALTATDITALAAPAEDVVWVGTRSLGLLSLIEGRLEVPRWARALPSGPISTLMQDRAGALWLGIEQQGLLRRNPAGRLEAAPDPAGTHWTPQSLLEDRAGALWAGSEARGLHVFHPVPFQGLPVSGGRLEEPAWAVCQDSDGTVWCLTGDQVLGVVRHGRIERVALPGGLSGPITALWPRRAGGLWLGTRDGQIHALAQNRLRRLPWPEGRPTTIQALYEDGQGTLWAATPRQGLLAFPKGAAPHLFPTVQGVLAMTSGPAGPLYLASSTLGLGILEAGQVRWLGRQEGLGSRGAQALYLDPEGRLWLGTPDGLKVFQNGAIRGFADRTGPVALAIHALLEDAGGRLWLGTGQGLFRIPRSALLKGLDDPGPIPTVLFDHHDGMPSRETQGGAQPLAWATREGDLYIPTSRGLARLEGRAAQPLSQPLRLHKLKVESDETILPEVDPIEVPPGTHRFEIYYTATSLTRADKVRFRYRLEGLESVWNEVGDRRFAAYSNLPPGSYRFALQAWRLDEEGPPQELFLPVHVRPFFHQRAVFWLFCALVLAAFGWWLLRLRLQQLEARTAVFAERNRMAREIHDHLAQGFTGVLLQLEAAEAKLTRMQGDPAPILTRLEHARSLAAASLQEARRSVMTLRPRRPAGTDLLGALHELADRLLTGTDIQVELAQAGRTRPLSDHLEEELLRMGQEALTNALRHGRAKWVRVTLRFEERQVQLSIADDGQGFDPKVRGGGYGLRSIRETIKRLKGRLDVDSSLGFGSCITITLPIRRWRP